MLLRARRHICTFTKTFDSVSWIGMYWHDNGRKIQVKAKLIAFQHFPCACSFRKECWPGLCRTLHLKTNKLAHLLRIPIWGTSKEIQNAMEQKRDVKPRWLPCVLDSPYLHASAQLAYSHKKIPCQKILHKVVTNIAEPSARTKWLSLSGAIAFSWPKPLAVGLLD